jgi:TRAP-type C4-dicarboxylate transport system substrate-binding protein
MNTKLRSALLTALAAALLLDRAAAAATRLKIATAAAPDSPWGQLFKLWKKDVESKTSGALTFDFYYNSTQGSEQTMVDKMRAGQLDGAAVTSEGLMKIDRRLIAIEMPGIVRTWAGVDALRDKVGPTFAKMLADKKVTMITDGDVGLNHVLSNGFAVHVPADLKGKSPWISLDDPIVKAMYGRIGGVNPHAQDVMAVLPDIDNGKINCIGVSALAAEMLQWSSKFDHGLDTVSGVVVGAVIMQTDVLDKLPADQRTAVLDAGKSMAGGVKGLKARIRNEDDAAWKRFSARSGVKIHKPSADEVKQWETLYKSTRDALRTGGIDPAIVSSLEAAAEK